MPDNIEQINKYIQQVVDCLVLKKDYKEKLKSFSPFILVEGSTDTAFLDKCKCEGVTCIPVSNLLKVDARMRRQPAPPKDSCKLAICNTIYGLSVIPAQIKCPEGATEWLLFGMVDQDFDDFENIRMTPRLFQTDTHDLETLLLSTDEKAINNIKSITFSAQEISRAECLAYEMSKLRQQIRSFSRLPLKLFKGSSGVVEYSEFTDGPDINVKKAIAYINSKAEHKLSKAEFNSLVEKIIAENGRFIERSGVFNYGSNGFDALFYYDFWFDVNGHDFLSALMYINENAYYKYYDSSKGELNRDFEFDLIGAYDISRFTTTRIYRRMHDSKLVEV